MYVTVKLGMKIWGYVNTVPKVFQKGLVLVWSCPKKGKILDWTGLLNTSQHPCKGDHLLVYAWKSVMNNPLVISAESLWEWDNHRIGTLNHSGVHCE